MQTRFWWARATLALILSCDVRGKTYRLWCLYEQDIPLKVLEFHSDEVPTVAVGLPKIKVVVAKKDYDRHKESLKEFQ